MQIPPLQDEVKRFNRIQKVLISIICAVLLLGVITLVSGVTAIEKFGYDTFTLLRYSLIERPFSTIRNWQDDLSELSVVRKENDELRKIISSQQFYKSQLDEQNRKIEELSALMDLEVNAIYEKEYASILYRDMNTYSNTITLNKGSKDGILKDMAVVSPKGLVGKVIEVNKNSCKVKLLTNETKDMAISIKVEIGDKTSDGILQYYDPNERVYHVQIFDTNAKLEKKQKIITSGNGGVFPSGIIVGNVKSIEKLYNEKGKLVKVTPSVDFNDLEYVAILKVKK